VERVSERYFGDENVAERLFPHTRIGVLVDGEVLLSQALLALARLKQEVRNEREGLALCDGRVAWMSGTS
jgi:hypothetical protein